jgi:hypothetical protein
MYTKGIVITVEPVGRHGQFRATFDGRVIVPASSTPFLDAARVLIAEGFSPRATLQMFHLGAAEAALTGPLWAAARLDVKDAKFVKHRPRAEGSAKADPSLTGPAGEVGAIQEQPSEREPASGGGHRPHPVGHDHPAGHDHRLPADHGHHHAEEPEEGR